MVLFGISGGEILLLTVVGIAVLGPKDMPRIARSIGYITGRAVRYVTAARSNFATFAENTELTQMHSEMRATLLEIQNIQDELRSGIGIVNPRNFTQQLLANKFRALEVPPPPPNTVGEHLRETTMEQPASSKAAARSPASPTVSEDGESAPSSRQKTEPIAALGLEHFQTFSAAANNGPPQGDMTDVHMQGFDAAAYAEFQALFDVPAGLAAPYVLPPSRMVKGQSEGGSAEGKEEAAGQQLPSVAEELLTSPHVGIGVAQNPVSSAAATDGAAVGEGVGESSVEGDVSGTAAVSAGVGVEQALFDAAVQEEIARQVRKFLQSDAGRATLMREILNTGTDKHPQV